MRILYITSSLPFGPGESFIIPEIIELIDRGHQVTVVPMAPRGSVVHCTDSFVSDNVVLAPIINFRMILVFFEMLLRNPKIVFRVLNYIKKSRNSAILIKNLAVLPKAFWLAKYCGKLRIDHIHSHWAASTSTLALLCSEVTQIKWSFTAHRWDIIENNLLDLKVKHANFVRFVSESGVELTKSLVPDLAYKKNKAMVHMGIDIPELGGIHRSKNPHIFLCPANLIPIKGHRFLIEAVHILRTRGIDIELWIAGDGTLRREIVQQVERLGLVDDIKFLGHLPHSKILDLYKRREVFCTILPSLDLGNGQHEGIPVALLEAMAYGVPVISTRTGGIPEALRHGAGLVVPPGNTQLLAEAIHQLLTDESLRSNLISQGRKKVREEFDIKNVCTKLTEMFVSS